MKCALLGARQGCSSASFIARLRSHRWLALLAIVLSAFPVSIGAQQPNEKNVLLLYNDLEQRTHFVLDFESSLRARLPGQVTFTQAYLATPDQNAEVWAVSEAETLRRRFLGLKFDLVVANGPAALSFAIQNRKTIFPGVPIVVYGIGTAQFQGKTWPGVTGLTVPVGIPETIDLALRLQPGTTAVAVVSPQDPFWLAVTHSALLRYKNKVKEIDLIAGPPNRELFEKIVALPAHTVVLFDLVPPLDGQPPYGNMDVIDEVAERLPTYSAWAPLCLNHGCIGGSFEDATKDSAQTAGLAARVLAGESPDNIPISEASGLTVRADWRALRRWHIPESALPPGTRVLYREPTLWEQGRKYFLAGIAVIFVQSLLIFGMFWQRTRRRKAELQLGKSEEKFSKAFRHSPLAITIVRARDGCYLDVNETFEVQTGWHRDEVIGRNPLEIGLWVNPAQRAAFVSELHENGNIRDLEVAFRRKDGQLRTSLGSTELIELNGEPCTLSVIADVTERKLAEEAISGFGRKLIEAQETERTRIARELHDDINQRLAMVAIGLKMLKQELPDSDPKMSRRIEEASVQVSELESDIQALSHRLHSSKLEYLGLEAASSSFCRELSERQNVKINFRCDGLPEDLSGDISLCLFRVLQEALHNAVKYSGVNQFEVSLECASEEIQLRVHDSGAGFDPRTTTAGHGLGLTSMKERLKLVSGELSIESKPHEGTTILARVPIDRGTTTADAAA